MSHHPSYEINEAQRSLLILAMGRNRILAKGGMDDERQANEQWTEIMNNLNAIGDPKNLDVWKQIWLVMVENSREKNITPTDIQILKIFDHGFPQNVTIHDGRIEHAMRAEGSNQLGGFQVGKSQVSVQNRLLTHMVGILNAHTRVVGNGFNLLNGNFKKVTKIIIKKKRRTIRN